MELALERQVASVIVVILVQQEILMAWSNAMVLYLLR
jgi:hypothetical protein